MVIDKDAILEILWYMIWKKKYNAMPDTILFSKGIEIVERVEFITDNPKEYITVGTFSFDLTNEILLAINKQIEEIEEKLGKKWK